jgi:hypothetical protein
MIARRELPVVDAKGIDEIVFIVGYPAFYIYRTRDKDHQEQQK